MSKPRGLGRGLGALIPELDEIESEGRLEIPLKQIQPNPYQPRKEFDSAKLEELAESIRTHGVLQPVLLRPSPEGYQLVAGERRLRAAELAGLTTIPALIKDLTDATMMQVALVENLQREDLNPLEEAEAYRRLMEEFQLTQDEVAKKVGKSRSAVANALRLLQLPAEVRDDLAAGRATAGHARAILGLADTAEQLGAWKEIQAEQLSVRETEEMVRSRTKRSVSRETRPGSKRSSAQEDPNLKEAEDRIRLALGTKVRIQGGSSGGRIEIQYYSAEELERILEVIIR